MARDGSGNYSLPSGQPVVTATTISSTVHNTFASDVAAALTASIAKDGQTVPTADLPMGTYKHTNVGSGSARTHYPSIAQLQDGSCSLVSSVAGTDTITGSLTPAITGYAGGMVVVFEPANTNTGAVTIALNGLAAKAIVKWDGDALIAGDLAANVPAVLVYDGSTNFILLNPNFPATLPAVSGANLTALNADNLSSGTVPDARFPATLPALSGANLTALNATNLASGTVPDARFPATLPALSGANLTALNASNLASGTVPDARFPATLPALSGANLTSLAAAQLTGDIAAARLATNGLVQGLTTIPVMAAAMQPATTNGAAPGTVETATNFVLYKTLDFDTTTQEFAGFAIPMPKNYNNGTLTFQPIWTAASGSGTVVWALQAVALSNDDAIDTAYGTEQTSTDTLLAAGDVHIGPTSSAITVAGTPADDDMLFFRIKRVPASDTLGVDARLIGIRLYFTTNAADDT